MTTTMQQPQAHVRRRSRVSIPIVPDFMEVEEDEVDEKHSTCSETDATIETHLLSAQRYHAPQTSGYDGREGQQAAASGATRKPWRALSLLTVVATASCLATATFLQMGPLKARYEASLENEPSASCDPYGQYGVLNVSLETPRENVWQPVAAAPECQPVNWVEMIAQAGRNGVTNPQLDHLRGRTIVVYGDSIDRDHVDHVCGFVGGQHEMIHDRHPLSPPYPPDEELPPPGYRNPITGDRSWLQNGQSRPWICHIPQLDLRILNVFHFGFQDLSEFLLNSPHYYPPARIEDRFDQIVVPLVASVAKHYGSNPIPDMLSVAPGFWTLLRETVDKQEALEKGNLAGVSSVEAHAQWRAQVWRTPSEWSRQFYEKRVAQVLRHVAAAWPATTTTRPPFLLWRAPHFVKESDRVPYNRLVALDQIGRSVVARLVAEGRAAASAGSRRWKSWTDSADSSSRSDGFGMADRAWARRAALDQRLRVDEWGARMLGQAQYFRDDIHPNALPGSYLYGNMLFHHMTTFLRKS